MKEELDAKQILKDMRKLQLQIDANLAYLENEEKKRTLMGKEDRL